MSLSHACERGQHGPQNDDTERCDGENCTCWCHELAVEQAKANEQSQQEIAQELSDMGVE